MLLKEIQFSLTTKPNGEIKFFFLLLLAFYKKMYLERRVGPAGRDKLHPRIRGKGCLSRFAGNAAVEYVFCLYS